MNLGKEKPTRNLLHLYWLFLFPVKGSIEIIMLILTSMLRLSPKPNAKGFEHSEEGLATAKKSPEISESKILHVIYLGEGNLYL